MQSDSSVRFLPDTAGCGAMRGGSARCRDGTDSGATEGWRGEDWPAGQLCLNTPLGVSYTVWATTNKKNEIQVGGGASQQGELGQLESKLALAAGSSCAVCSGQLVWGVGGSAG